MQRRATHSVDGFYYAFPAQLMQEAANGGIYCIDAFIDSVNEELKNTHRIIAAKNILFTLRFGVNYL